ncbi:MAG: aminoacetone oxidase family FAD-binding enzyme, partial [Gammaproteobacteria bacterium]|nr:aminoacetone oxidase family FAD-binding enzyme [Gammaproteobacteria bacterium]
MLKFDVIVIGAGAAGLMAAATAASRGRRVMVLEKAAKPGRKILMSGGGRCNFTNYNISADNYLCANPHFVKSALSKYTQWDFLSLINKYKIKFHERDHGQLFCDDSAKDILNLLLAECELGNVNYCYQCEISKIERINNQFLIVDSQLRDFACESLIVATGGLSIPSMKGDGLGYRIAEQFKMPCLPRRAGLVPFTASGELKAVCDSLSGMAWQSEVSVNDGRFLDPLLFTHRGLSGPAALQISNYWLPGDAVTIDLYPQGDLYQALLDAKAEHSQQKVRTALGQLLSRALIGHLPFTNNSAHLDQSIGNVKNIDLKAIADACQQWRVKPTATEGYRTAEVTIGGVDTNWLSSKTMESHTVPRLYFVGEVVDVVGWLGGYNFQWA